MRRLGNKAGCSRYAEKAKRSAAKRQLDVTADSEADASRGEPIVQLMDAELTKVMLSIGAVKGIEFGSGFAAACILGSEHNDQMRAAVGF